jgi:hypothetical protein
MDVAQELKMCGNGVYRLVDYFLHGIAHTGTNLASGKVCILI